MCIRDRAEMPLFALNNDIVSSHVTTEVVDVVNLAELPTAATPVCVIALIS